MPSPSGSASPSQSGDALASNPPSGAASASSGVIVSDVVFGATAAGAIVFAAILTAVVYFCWVAAARRRKRRLGGSTGKRIADALPVLAGSVDAIATPSLGACDHADYIVKVVGDEAEAGHG